MLGVFVTVTESKDELESVIDYMDKITNEWTDRAARGECAWVCSDCCMTFPEGMPDECAHSLSWCTEIIERDKNLAKETQ